MAKKYQIFVSSTFVDLKDERQEAIRTILDMGHIPAGMELFPATDVDQLTYIKKVIDECDYYVLIMGGRYGSVDEEGISYTEREYDYAMSTGKQVLAFPHADPKNLTVAKSEISPEAIERLEEFRKRVMKGRIVRSWAKPYELDGKITRAINYAITTYPAPGWVRGDAVASEDILLKINELREKNQWLELKLADYEARKAPQIDDLASLDESLTMRYTASTMGRMGPVKNQYSLTLTWAEIFKLIGPRIRIGASPRTIAAALAKYLNDIHAASGEPVFHSSVVPTIESQFVAHGLLEFAPEKGATKLTARGEDTLMHLLAVRTKVETPTNNEAKRDA